MTEKKVLVLLPLQEEDKAYFESRIRGAAQPCSFFFRSEGEVTDEEIASSHVVIGKLPVGRIRDAACLEWLQLPSAGVDAYTKPGLLPSDVLLTNGTGAYGLAVSEHMLASTLALVRRFPEYMRRQAEHNWKPMGNITSIEGSTVLVLGLGDIGGRYAGKMKALGAYVIGFRKTDKNRPEYVDEQYTMDRLPEMIGRADIVAMVLPGGRETENLMDAEMLGRMKKGSFLINCGRGSAVNLKALREALDEGRLAGAALDVTDPEPLPADDPLWDYGNVLLTPHVAGNFWLRRTLQNVIRISADNLARYLNGEPLDHVVERTKGY
ncbi:MAG: D-2-hydroxyacid dehydrogenase [Eubacteriales bacterium]|nr:D-2-hydroxyacid dehydrogenase [Eubacteriales bacterium]